MHSSAMRLKTFGGEMGDILAEFEVGLKPGAYRFWKSCDTQTPSVGKMNLI